ncbi:MAG: hypothetical protein KDD25_02045 [Bdellovibrionales bacterium]|nr:hypothetical protein [Bdellovibrionales bacterium]
MKSFNYIGRALFAGVAASAIAAGAQAATKYDIKIVNAGAMPISPPVLYVSSSGLPESNVGSVSTPGFIQVCQTGNPALRVEELKKNSNVKSIEVVPGPILPGDERIVTIKISNPAKESIHIESMYGKTRDTCASTTVSSHSLVALKQHVLDVALVQDVAVQSGAFLDPVLPEYPVQADCEDKDSAVACLRTFAALNEDEAKIRFFRPYLPNVLDFLVTKYGAADVLTLSVPTAGAVQTQVRLNH